jgi:hypothetical protein
MTTTREIKLDERKLFEIYLTRLIQNRWWIYLLIWGMTTYFMYDDSSNDISRFMLVFSILYPIITVLNLWRFVNSDKNKIFFLKRTYELTDDKIIGKLDDESTTEISIKNIIKVVNNKKYYLLYISQGQFLYIPKDRLDNLGTDYLNSLQNKVIETVQDSKKPTNIGLGEVLIGIFFIGALIPFWGLIAALGLLINILVIKKLKKLSILFLVLSIASTTSMFFYGRYMMKKLDKPGFQEQMVPFCQMRINELVPKIEYYKMIKGEYPVVLSDLKQIDSTLTTKDFSYRIKGGYNPEYLDLYYLKLDSNSYQLFAIGKDSLPNTDDDIIPEITQDEINKLGPKLSDSIIQRGS